MKLIFCTECQGKLDKLTDTEYRCQKCGQSLWNNPHTTVAVVLLKAGKILVAKRGREPNIGKFDLPGGFVEYGEDPYMAAQRELLEEAGIQIDDLELLTAYSGFYTDDEPICDLIILARTWHGKPVAADDVAGLTWQPLSFLDSADFVPDYGGLIERLTKLTVTAL